MRRIAVAEPLRDIAHFHIGVLQHPAGDGETRMIQHLGVAGAHFTELTLQVSLTGITQLSGELDTQVSFLDVGLQELLE